MSRTELGRRLQEARRQMAEAGIPFLTDEELDRLADQRRNRHGGGCYCSDCEEARFAR